MRISLRRRIALVPPVPYVIVLSLVLTTAGRSQTVDAEVRDAIAKVDNGQSEAVRQVLPELVAKYQNNPGIMYLQGRLATDGIEAVKFYQSVVDNFPKSEWADDALYRIYQYYYSLGIYRMAQHKMDQLRRDYPNSPYVTGNYLSTPPAEEDTPVRLPTKGPVTPDTLLASAADTAVAAPYTLQVGAFSTVSNAQKQKDYFEDLGYNVEVTNKIRGGRSLYLVWVGSFKTAEDARLFGREVKSKYKIESIIVERY